jgi:Zn-dependent protease
MLFWQMGDDSGVQILSYALAVIPTFLSVTVHEYAHARMAIALGDTTSREAERDTLNPQSHLDILGSVLVPIVAARTFMWPLIGWGRPIPCWPAKFRAGVPPKLGLLLVSIAGPLGNLLFSLFATTLLFWGQSRGFFDRGTGTPLKPLSIAALLLMLSKQNAAFAFFHLLPLPPFDGYRLLPGALQSFMQPYERYGTGIALIILMFLPNLAGPLLEVPATWMSATVLRIVAAAFAVDL